MMLNNIEKVSYEQANNNIDGIKIINQSDINSNLMRASKLNRGSRQIILHDSFSDAPQKFVNCLTPNSYIRPYMHSSENQWKLMCWISGEIIVLFFDDEGVLRHKVFMDDQSTKVIEIPPLCYHSFLAIKNSAYLEIRNCSYGSTVDRTYAKWSLPENDYLALKYHNRLLCAGIGDLVAA